MNTITRVALAVLSLLLVYMVGSAPLTAFGAGHVLLLFLAVAGLGTALYYGIEVTDAERRQ